MSGSQSLCSLSECKVVYVCLCVNGKENLHVFLCFEHGHVCCLQGYCNCVCVCLLVFTASAAFPSWGPEALGHPGVQAGPGAACICGMWKQSWVWEPWVSHLELRPGSLQTQAPAMQADDNRR